MKAAEIRKKGEEESFEMKVIALEQEVAGLRDRARDNAVGL